MDNKVTIEGLDIIDLVQEIDKKDRRFKAVCLQALEELTDLNPEEFKVIRKIILDSMSSYTRSLVRMLFGEIEVDIYKPNRRD